jgi:hypothetical protein
MSKLKRTERKIRGLSDLSKKQRVIFKEFLSHNRLKPSRSELVLLIAVWLDGVAYGKWGHRWVRPIRGSRRRCS